MGQQVPKRKLGNTGLSVPIIGFGASPLGGIYQPLDESLAVQAVHEAFKFGINFFDTSPYYGLTRSEKVLGRALKDLPRDQIIIATKVGRYGADTFDFSAERVTRSVHESLERLQVQYIDIIQTHDIEFGDIEQVITETLPALQRLKEQGVVRFIGITGLPLKIFRTVLDRCAPGTVDVILSYCHYCLNDTSLESILPYLEQKGVGVINASILSMGLLTQQGPPSWHPAPEEVKTACKAAADQAKELGSDISLLAIKAALRNPSIQTHLIGFTKPEQVRDNVATALSQLTAAEEGTLSNIKQILAPIQNVSWPSGRPENNQ
ncbi:L-galactose dehydrogenase [Coccomyxa subellipsoidea C-169]|uniref:L-galactose dehydrogenase n=1 Tax=Coccomyxa subellipsoidea (strain C-169) TaxID=574566 RepID=I0YRD5_COCSC|nr:L-galactose dehydrogenase [Coccomyxa subellipsoidea C-169]EIE20954.1 L-galactose dehydrogenase [Coccomyxa subellipsoidea C-169]|eukprot:XP_005645498.1 L-galactose dehydrogenase [Coccomyxa subellipsoidea C-169]